MRARPCANHPDADTLAAIWCRVCGAYKTPGELLTYLAPEDPHRGNAGALRALLAIPDPKRGRG